LRTFQWCKEHLICTRFTPFIFVQRFGALSNSYLPKSKFFPKIRQGRFLFTPLMCLSLFSALICFWPISSLPCFRLVHESTWLKSWQ
jgi:hypothetical protein